MHKPGNRFDVNVKQISLVPTHEHTKCSFSCISVIGHLKQPRLRWLCLMFVIIVISDTQTIVEIDTTRFASKPLACESHREPWYVEIMKLRALSIGPIQMADYFSRPSLLLFHSLRTICASLAACVLMYPCLTSNGAIQCV